MHAHDINSTSHDDTVYDTSHHSHKDWIPNITHDDHYDAIDWRTDTHNDHIDTLGVLMQDDRALMLGGHTISYDDDFMSFECVTCDTSFEVPEIFQASDGFRTIVYQLYLLGHLRKETCPGRPSPHSDKEPNPTRPFDDPFDDPGSVPPINPGDTFWIDNGGPISYHGEEDGNNYWISNGMAYTTSELVNDLSQDAAESFAMETGMPGAVTALQEDQNI